MVEDKCDSCRFWEPIEDRGSRAYSYTGYCRRYPPVKYIMAWGDSETSSPETTKFDFCGEWSKYVE